MKIIKKCIEVCLATCILVRKYAASALRPKKRNSSEGEKFETKVVGNGSSYCSTFYNLINEEGSAKKHAFLDVICKISKNQGFFCHNCSIFRFHKKKIGTVT